MKFLKECWYLCNFYLYHQFEKIFPSQDLVLFAIAAFFLERFKILFLAGTFLFCYSLTGDFSIALARDYDLVIMTLEGVEFLDNYLF